MDTKDPLSQLDLLRHIETLAEDINKKMNKRSRSVIRRYPITFMLLVLLGAMAVAEGLKGLLMELGIFDGHPLYLFLAGIAVLAVTGTLYRKLDS